MVQGWEVNGCQHKYKEESNGDNRTKMRQDERFEDECSDWTMNRRTWRRKFHFQRPMTSIQNSIEWRRLVAASSSL